MRILPNGAFATALLRESGGKGRCDGHHDVDKKCKKSDKH
jgi:tRNA(Glu) U13 pseudouridine synthase TruD